MKKRPMCFIDVETTGLNPVLHEIIEIAIIKEHPNRQTEHFYAKIKPLAIERADETALKINRFRERGWTDAREPKVVAAELSKFLDGCSVCAHNVNFDMDFISEFLCRYDMQCYIDRRYIDTMTLVHEHLLICGLSSMSLDAVRRFFGWSLVESHTAEKDVMDVYRLYHILLRATFWSRWHWKIKNKIFQFVRKLTQK
tara:strand:- start:1980 stop:2573 length:594 start_codon:yes stop_codon:yes gene_type:complete